jgi:hypothetical protein
MFAFRSDLPSSSCNKYQEQHGRSMKLTAVIILSLIPEHYKLEFGTRNNFLGFIYEYL